MKPKTDSTQLSRDVQEILNAVRNAPATAKEPQAEPEEIDEAPGIEALFGMVANGCGRHDNTGKDNADFISPLLLAA